MFVFFKVLGSADYYPFVDRKELERLAEDSDDDDALDEKFLNLEGDDGSFFVVARFCHRVDDVPQRMFGMRTLLIWKC